MYSFAFGVNGDRIFLTETHKVTASGNGMVCCLSSTRQQPNNQERYDSFRGLCSELAILIEKRLLFSLSKKTYKEVHEINILTHSPLDDLVVQALQLMGNENHHIPPHSNSFSSNEFLNVEKNMSIDIDESTDQIPPMDSFETIFGSQETSTPIHINN